MPKIYLRAIFRDVKSHIGRFMAILMIIFLGIAFFVGVKAAGPSMKGTADRYYKKVHLADLTLISNYGLSKEDLAFVKGKVKRADGVKAMPLTLENPSATLNVMAYNKDNQLNQLVIKSGRLPKNDHEIVMDSFAQQRLGLHLGQKLHLLDENQKNKEGKGQLNQGLQLLQADFTLVGFVQSPEFVEKGFRSLAQSDIHYDYFAYVGEGAIKGEIFSKILVANDYKDHFDSKAYTDKVDQLKKKIQRGSKSRRIARRDEINKKVAEEIRKSKDRLAQAKHKLAEGQKQLDEGKRQIELMRGQFGQSQMPALLAKAESFKREESTFLAEKEKREKEIRKAEAEIARQEKAVKNRPLAKWYLLDRNANPGYAEFSDNAERISAIASVFPVFFFLVAALMSFTSMKRMIDEQRLQIGMYRGMGYSRQQIMAKYLIYALLATVLGSGLGLMVGYPLFPPLIYGAYSSLYNIPDFKVVASLGDSTIAVSFALFSTVGAAVFISWRTLREVPAQLLRPKPPKKGKQIFLERWKFFWKRISFNRKMTLRNLFRYKGRNAMTILGVAGSTALIVTGFGINDSISNLAHQQFREVITYQGIVRLDEKAENVNRKEVLKSLEKEKGIQKIVPVYTKELTLEVAGGYEETASLMVPLDSQFKDVVDLRNRLSQDKIELKDDGAVATEKLSKLLKGEKTYQVTGLDRECHLPIKAIAENYLGHYLYMTDKAYQSFFGQKAQCNALLIQYKNPTDRMWEKKLINRLSHKKAVSSYVSLAAVHRSFQDAINGLSIITTVLVISAGLLAFVVLFTLTQMNIQERRLELATIKVLGFYNREVSWYIFQELLILSAWGIFLGGGLGYALNAFVLKTCEINKMLFPPTVSWQSYLYSALLTLLFAAIVMGFMAIKLTRVNMVEALKAED